MRNMYAFTCDSCGKHFKKPAGPGPHWCGCPWDWLKECLGCGSSFMAVTNQAEEVCSVQCKVAAAASKEQ
jgi:hypothetical protein